MTKAKKPFLDSYRKFALILVILSVIGLIASFILTVEKINLLKYPSSPLSCNLNPIVSCGSVIESGQAEAFGFTNSLIGLAGFSVIITIGVGMLAGAKYKKWFWLGLQAGTILGVIFAHWLFYQSVYVIQALCPFCIVVWAVVIGLFVYTTSFNFAEGNIKTPKQLSSAIKWLTHNAWFIVALWYLAIIVAILTNFWYYGTTLF